MELSLARCEQILHTLPIGYYAGRRIEVTMDKEETTSFYSPMEDKIIVSYPVIKQSAKAIPAGADDERAVRSMLYHEVSHAILTPVNLRSSIPVNIFEDERIETLLRHYYHGVDFKQQLWDIHEGKIPKATKPEQAFFNAVRFGCAPQRILNSIQEIISKYKELNRTSPRYGKNGSTNYSDEIHDLYDEITKAFRKNPDDFNASSPMQGKKGQKMDEIKQSQDSQSSNGTEFSKLKNEDGNGNNGEEGEENPFKGNPETSENELSREEMKRMCGASLGTMPDLSKAQIQKLDDFQKNVETIIGNFNKKNSGGSGINAYSGVFNPRAVVRQDYRFFERAMTTQGNNRFGTCHLNLIIDCSGSYINNVPVTNGILKVLTDIERKNRNFSMDVCFINHEFHKCESPRERIMEAWGGNAIPQDMKQILLDLQKPQTCNYNIILFDGDAICNYGDTLEKSRKRFDCFDMKQTTMITDPDNQNYIHDWTSTKVIITTNYTEELIKHIQNALSIAFG